MSDHTPGPWEVGQYGNSFIVTAKANSYDVAVVRNIGNEDNEANARLIAAAPELLAALQRYMEVCPADEDTTAAFQEAANNARAAIAKATGSPA
jgi:hypothetical protein